MVDGHLVGWLACFEVSSAVDGIVYATVIGDDLVDAAFNFFCVSDVDLVERDVLYVWLYLFDESDRLLARNNVDVNECQPGAAFARKRQSACSSDAWTSTRQSQRCVCRDNCSAHPNSLQ